MTEQNSNMHLFTNEIISAESAISDLKTRMAGESANARKWAQLIGVLLIPLVLHHFNIYQMSLWVVVPIWIIVFFFLMAWLGTTPEKSKSEIEKWESIKRIYLGIPDNNDNTTYFDKLVAINIEYLSEYYALVKYHTSRSFKTALFAGITGFLLTAIGVYIGVTNKDNQYIATVAAGAGILTNVISGIFFYLYNKTVRQLKEYHDSLLNVQNILLSFKLIEGIKDENNKNCKPACNNDPPIA